MDTERHRWRLSVSTQRIEQEGQQEGRKRAASGVDGVAHWVGRLGTPYWPLGDGPTTIDLFAGCGGLSLRISVGRV